MQELTIVRCNALLTDVWVALARDGHGPYDVIDEFRGEGGSVFPSQGYGGLEYTLFHPQSMSLPVLAATCEELFRESKSHYTLDPLLGEAWGREGYKDWLVRLATGGAESSGVAVCLQEQEIVGFVGWQRRDCLVIELYGVLSKVRGRGIGKDLIAFAMSQEQSRLDSLPYVSLSTPFWNLQSRRAAVSVGLKPYRSALTFHIWR
jgi:ribosomal protein S18 acetylase RimI-like enzyme